MSFNTTISSYSTSNIAPFRSSVVSTEYPESRSSYMFATRVGVFAVPSLSTPSPIAESKTDMPLAIFCLQCASSNVPFWNSTLLEAVFVEASEIVISESPYFVIFSPVKEWDVVITVNAA